MSLLISVIHVCNIICFVNVNVKHVTVFFCFFFASFHVKLILSAPDYLMQINHRLSTDGELVCFFDQQKSRGQLPILEGDCPDFSSAQIPYTWSPEMNLHLQKTDMSRQPLHLGTNSSLDWKVDYGSYFCKLLH